MKARLNYKNESGLILILALWTLTLLTVFTVTIAMGVRQRITLVRRLSDRESLHWIATSGVHKAWAAYWTFKKKGTSVLTGPLKEYLYDNPAFFKNMKVANGICTVSYPDISQGSDLQRKYGMQDEERKLNVNYASQDELTRLIEEVVGLGNNQAKSLANAIVDWREMGQGESAGLSGSDTGGSQADSHREKKGNFELPEELLLVKGITPAVYDRLQDYVTVYGNGQVNINTAPRAVLLALGLNEEIVAKIVFFRRGVDGREDTADDPIISQPQDVYLSVYAGGALTGAEADLLMAVFSQGVLGTASEHLQIQAQGYLASKQESRSVTCVFEKNSGKIIYWREK